MVTHTPREITTTARGKRRCRGVWDADEMALRIGALMQVESRRLLSPEEGDLHPTTFTVYELCMVG